VHSDEHEDAGPGDDAEGVEDTLAAGEEQGSVAEAAGPGLAVELVDGTSALDLGDHGAEDAEAPVDADDVLVPTQAASEEEHAEGRGRDPSADGSSAAHRVSAGEAEGGEVSEHAIDDRIAAVDVEHAEDDVTVADAIPEPATSAVEGVLGDPVHGAVCEGQLAVSLSTLLSWP